MTSASSSAHPRTAMSVSGARASDRLGNRPGQLTGGHAVRWLAFDDERVAQHGQAADELRRSGRRPRPHCQSPCRQRAAVASAAVREAASASRSIGRRPSSTAQTTAARIGSMSAAASCAPVSTASAPAMSDRTKPSAMPIVPAMARISSASVTIVPMKPRCSRSSPVVIGRLTVAGDSASSAGTSRCPVMIARAPAAIPARNGTSSSASSSSRFARDGRQLVVRVGRWWRHGRESAWGRRRRPPRCTPRTAAATWRAATCGIGAERTDADHRVARIEVDVGNRGEVDRDPSARQPPADRRVHRFGGCRVVERTERGGARGRTAAPARRAGSRRRPPRPARQRHRARRHREAPVSSDATCEPSPIFEPNSTTPPRPSARA